MTKVIVVPDTGLLLAIGYGRRIDSKAPVGIKSLQLARSKGNPLVAVGTVADELETKLDEISAVIPALQRAFANLTESPRPLSLREVERLMVQVKADVPPRVVRYVDAIEAEAARLARARPQKDVRAIASIVLAGAVALEEAVRARVDSLHLEIFRADVPADQSIPPELAGIGRADVAHVRSCEFLARERKTRVCFVVFEATLHARRDDVTRVYPGVTVTTPHYLSTYLEEEPTALT